MEIVSMKPLINYNSVLMVTYPFPKDTYKSFSMNVSDFCSTRMKFCICLSRHVNIF